MSELYPLAVQAVGPVSDDEWPDAVREKMVQIALHRHDMSEFAAMIERAMTTGNKGWGVIEGVITGAWIDPKKAHRGFVQFEAWSSRKNARVTETIRTEPTNTDPRALAIINKAQGMIGHSAKMFKRPDPRPRNADEVSRDLFHLVDLGPAPAESQQGPDQTQQAPRQTQPAQAPAPAPAQQAQPQQAQAPAQQAPAEPAPETQQASQGGAMQDNRTARKSLYAAVGDLYPEAPREWKAQTASQAWAKAGLSAEGDVSTDDLDRAFKFVQETPAPQ